MIIYEKWSKFWEPDKDLCSVIDLSLIAGKKERFFSPSCQFHFKQEKKHDKYGRFNWRRLYISLPKEETFVQRHAEGQIHVNAGQVSTFIVVWFGVLHSIT